MSAVAAAATPAPFFPATGTIRYSITDTSLPTKSIDELVSAIRATRGELTEFRVALVADAGLVSQLPARALVSVRKAGASQILFAAYTKDGTLLGAPVRVVLPSIDPTGDSPDLKLRVRLGGYSLDLGRGVIDIPRVRDDSGLHFDLPSLEAQANVRRPRSAAVSFMPDVAAEQILLAMFRVRPAKTPIDLVIQ